MNWALMHYRFSTIEQISLWWAVWNHMIFIAVQIHSLQHSECRSRARRCEMCLTHSHTHSHWYMPNTIKMVTSLFACVILDIVFSTRRHWGYVYAPQKSENIKAQLIALSLYCVSFSRQIEFRLSKPVIDLALTIRIIE